MTETVTATRTMFWGSVYNSHFAAHTSACPAEVGYVVVAVHNGVRARLMLPIREKLDGSGKSFGVIRLSERGRGLCRELMYYCEKIEVSNIFCAFAP
jgi:hypothetical protein